MDTLQETIQKANQVGAQASGITGIPFTPLQTDSLTGLAQGAGVAQTPITPSLDMSQIEQGQNITPAPDMPRTSSQAIISALGQAPSAVGDDTAVRQTEDEFASLVKRMRGRSTAEAELTEDVGIPEIEAQIRDIGADIQRRRAQLTAQIVGQEGRGTDARLVEGRQGLARRQAAAEIEGLAAAQAAAQGQLTTAQSAVTRAINAKYGPIEEEIAIQKELLGLRKEQMSRDQQKRAEKRETFLAQLEAQLVTAQEKEKSAYDAVMTAMVNGFSASDGASLMEQIASGKVQPSEAFGRVASYIKDPLETRLQNLKIRETELSIDQLNTYHDVIDDPQWGQIVNSTAGLVGSERGKQIRKDMAQNIANGNYKAAWADVTNAVEEKLTGENATKFGAQVTDYEVLGRLEDAITQYSEAGGDLGLLKGKSEEISRKLLGVTGNPELSALAVQLEREFQTYRVAITGAAFSPEESRDYAKVNPRTTASLDLNLATIQGAKNQMESRILSTVSTRVPGAEKLWQINTGQTSSEYLDEVDAQLQDTSDDPINSLLEDINRNLSNLRN